MTLCTTCNTKRVMSKIYAPLCTGCFKVKHRESFLKKVKSWTLPSGIRNKAWAVIQYDSHHCIVPIQDIDIHNVFTLDCKCKPDVSIDTNNVTTVLHNSFRDTKKVDQALKRIRFI